MQTHDLNAAMKASLARKVGRKHTHRAARSAYKRLWSFIGAELLKMPTVADFNAEIVEAFILAEMSTPSMITGKPREASSVSRDVFLLKSFDRELCEYFPNRRSAFIGIEIPKPIIKPAHGLSYEQYQQVVDYLEEARDIPQDTRLAFSLAIGTGLRPFDISRIPFGSVDLNGGMFLGIPICKGHAPANKLIGKQITREAKRYLPVRESALTRHFSSHGQNYSDQSKRVRGLFPLLVSVRGANPSNPDSYRFDTRTLLRKLGKIRAESGVSEANFRCLRHTRAHHVLDATKDIRAAAHELGHNDVKTTMRYTQPSNAQQAQMIEAVEQHLQRKLAGGI